MKINATPCRKTLCRTCPFRKGSPYAHLADSLAGDAIFESKICHSTGSNAINHRTGISNHLCRGARRIQLMVMHGMGVISAPTDKAWNEARVKIGMKPIEIRDPK